MLEFIRQYIEGYDQDDRSPLIAAYHPNSMFSMSAIYPAGSTAHGASKLTHYQVDSRNLQLILQPSKRSNFLKMGNENVIKFINSLPKTQHDLNSFTLGKFCFQAAPAMLIAQPPKIRIFVIAIFGLSY